MPWPKRPPLPKASHDWMIWKPLPRGSAHGSQNAVMRRSRYGAMAIAITSSGSDGASAQPGDVARVGLREHEPGEERADGQRRQHAAAEIVQPLLVAREERGQVED